jgi:transposase
MKRIPKGVFTREFKEEAVRMVTEGGLSIHEVGRRLSVCRTTVGYWVKNAKAGMLSDRGQTSEEMEVARLRRENAELKMERDILKKAAAYFARESLPGTRG